MKYCGLLYYSFLLSEAAVYVNHSNKIFTQLAFSLYHYVLIMRARLLVSTENILVHSSYQLLIKLHNVMNFMFHTANVPIIHFIILHWLLIETSWGTGCVSSHKIYNIMGLDLTSDHQTQCVNIIINILKPVYVWFETPKPPYNNEYIEQVQLTHIGTHQILETDRCDYVLVNVFAHYRRLPSKGINTPCARMPLDVLIHLVLSSRHINVVRSPWNSFEESFK